MPNEQPLIGQQLDPQQQSSMCGVTSENLQLEVFLLFCPKCQVYALVKDLQIQLPMRKFCHFVRYMLYGLVECSYVMAAKVVTTSTRVWAWAKEDTLAFPL